MSVFLSAGGSCVDTVVDSTNIDHARSLDDENVRDRPREMGQRRGLCFIDRWSGRLLGKRPRLELVDLFEEVDKLT
jgi:hypothetical protein